MIQARKSPRPKAVAGKVVDKKRVSPADVDEESSDAGGKDAENFLAVTWPIDTSIGISNRPMTGKDVENFRARHRLQTSDVIYALCIQNSAKFNEVCRLPALPFTLELLIRLYDEHPGHAPWTDASPQAAFETLYGSVAKDFSGSPLAKDVRLALYRRFTGAMGRSIYTAYRWVQGHGNAKSQVTKVFAKLMTVKDPRETLERIARLMYRTRNHDLDALYPMPSLDRPPIPRRRGPPKGSRRVSRSPEEALVAVVAKPRKDRVPRVAVAKKSRVAVKKAGKPTKATSVKAKKVRAGAPKSALKRARPSAAVE